MSNVVSLMIGAVVGFVYAAILASVTMNATERARRSDSLYYDTQVTNRRALCDMIAHLESDLAESKAENAKLSELVRDMYACISHANEQDWFYFERDKLGCGMSCTVNGEACGLCALADRMRELGLEVG